MQARLGDYALGAAVATDLVNTAPEVMVSTGDRLANSAALARFLDEHELHPEALADGRRPTVDELASVYALRRTLREIIDAPAAGDAVAGANLLVARAAGGPTLQAGSNGRWYWHTRTRPGTTLADELAVLTGTSLLGVIHTLGHDRYRRCASPACNGVFVDTSRSGRRRYCVPEVCGNRINVANHRARRRTRQPTSLEERELR